MIGWVTEFDEATKYFTDLRELDPFRMEDIDTFSNILYVSEKRAELAMLAQEYTKMDRSRPETCCLVGEPSPFPSSLSPFSPFPCPSLLLRPRR